MQTAPGPTGIKALAGGGSSGRNPPGYGRECWRAPGRLLERIVDCTEVMEQIADYLDEDVRAKLRKEVEAHLHDCRDCSYYVDTVNKTVVLYQAARRIEIPMRATRALHAALAAEYALDERRTPPASN